MGKLSNKILDMDEGIQSVLILDRDGRVQDLRQRSHTQNSSMPFDLIRDTGPFWSYIFSESLDKLIKYYGITSRVVVHMQKADAILLSLNDNIIVLTVNKNVPSDILARRIKEELGQ